MKAYFHRIVELNPLFYEKESLFSWDSLIKTVTLRKESLVW